MNSSDCSCSISFPSSIFPELFYTVNRTATPSWRLADKSRGHNVMLIYSGEAEFCRDGEIYTAKSGDLVYYRPGDVRTARTFEHSPVRCFAADFDYVCPVYDRENGEWRTEVPPLPLPFYQTITDPYLFDRLTGLFTSLTRSSLSGPVGAVKSRQRAIFTEILELLIHYTNGGSYSYSDAGKVSAVINHMTEHFAESITLTRLAEVVGISESHLGKIFKAVTGKPPIDYLLDIRINRAKELLSDGVSVTETSRLVGFNDIYYFSRAFKKREGVSPSVYSNNKTKY